MKKRILALLLAAVLVFGLLPTAALAADSPWTGIDGGASGIKVDTAPSAVKWALTISPKASGLANDSDVYAVVIPTDVYSKKPASFLTSINATTYAEASKLGLSAGDHRATTVKYAGGGAIPLPAMTLPSFAVQPATYHKQYTYVLFSNRRSGDVKDYYTGTFWVDTEGNTGTRDASYMVRYNGNATSVGSNQSVSGTPGNVITKPESANTALTFSGISRQGYTFLGWDTNKDLMGTVPNDAAAGSTQPTYVTGSNPNFKPADTSRVANEIQDLYAIWKPMQVTIAAQAQAMGELRVGVSFTYTPILGGAAGTTKKVSVSAADATWLAEHGLSIHNNTITGVPTVWTTEGKDITLTATDESNKTTATLVVSLPKIEKGLQPRPDMTVTTGLSTTMVDDADESTNDGRLIGFYAAGQTPQKDSANASMTDGTGTYTNYYLTKGMIYEYRPMGDENALWREIPAPEKLYSGLTPGQKTAFLASLEAGAITRYKTTITSKTAATCEAQLDGTAWDATYGAIQFVDGAPVVTGLAKDAVYEVRFRESATFDASTAVTITVAGSSSGGGPSGYALVFNFAGGGVEVDELPLFATQEGLNNTTVTLPEAVPTRENCAFDGWLDNRSGTLYQPGETVEITDSSASLSAKWTATTEGFVSITFYDWDETTVLGSIVVPKGADASAEVAAFVKSLMADGSRDKAILNGADNENLPYFVDDSGFQLSNKRGYSFYGWLPYDSGLYTHCGRAIDGNNKQIYIAEPRLTDQDEEGTGTVLAQQTQSFLNLTENVLVKTCYKDNSEMLYTALAGDMYYQTKYVAHNRVGNSVNYSVTAEVTRTTESGQGVPRMVQPMLKVTSTLTAGGALVAFYDLKNMDSTQLTFYPSTGIKQVRCNVVDMYLVTNQGAVSNKSSNNDENQGTGAAMDGFLWKGTVTMIGDAVASNTLSLLTANVLQTQGNLPLTANSVSAAKAQEYLRTAWVKKNSEDGTEATLRPEGSRKSLSFEEMIHAIENAGEWKPQSQINGG